MAAAYRQAQPVIRKRRRSVLAASLLGALCVCQLGCRGKGDQVDRGDNAGAAVNEGSNASASAGTISAPRRLRDLPTVDARSAARQVALMPTPTDHDAAARIALLAEVYRLAIESDGGANNYYLLAAGNGVEFEAIDMDAHEFALRILAPLGAPMQKVPPHSVRHEATHIAWAPTDVQDQVRTKLNRRSADAAPTRATFPGTREAASLIVVSLNSPDDASRLQGTITIESPDGRMARQGFQAMRSGSRWTNIRFTGVRVEW